MGVPRWAVYKCSPNSVPSLALIYLCVYWIATSRPSSIWWVCCLRVIRNFPHFNLFLNSVQIVWCVRSVCLHVLVIAQKLSCCASLTIVSLLLVKTKCLFSCFWTLQQLSGLVIMTFVFRVLHSLLAFPVQLLVGSVPSFLKGNSL